LAAEFRGHLAWWDHALPGVGAACGPDRYQVVGVYNGRLRKRQRAIGKGGEPIRNNYKQGTYNNILIII
jgi:hypothetical protein